VSAVEFVCPLCKGELQRRPEAYECARDRRTFRMKWGIPDFRVYPDPYIGFAAEDQKVARLMTVYPSATLDELVAYYYSITDDVSPSLAQKYCRYVASAVARGESALAEVQQAGARAGGMLLEIGCGTGGLLTAANGTFEPVVGVDIALRWLIIAQKRLQEVGSRATLVCACAEFLPFRGDCVQLVVANDVVEHARGQVGLLREARRVLAAQGALFLSTPNRWSLAPDPHMQLFGLGFLPPRWRQAYVRAARQVPYRVIRTLNYFELQRLVLRSGFERWQLFLPEFKPAHVARLSRGERAVVPLYHALKDWPVLKWFVCLFGPLFHVICFK
jgi:SAM-dependent methyltransferase